jgi:hypothetical protein
MKPTSNPVLVAGALVMGSLLGSGLTSARAQAPGTTPMTAPSGSYPPPAARPVVYTLPAARPVAGNADPSVTHPVLPPGPAGAGVAPTAVRASDPAARTGPTASPARSPSGSVERSYWTAPPPPPKKPSALRRAFNFVFRTEETSGSESRAIYVDPSTGRTDLPLSKPWLKSSQ